MMYAAKSLNIPIFELQHGMFNHSHPSYSYPASIKGKGDNVVLPDMLLTFSKYWGKGVNFPTEIISIGNDYFAARSESLTDNSILFISSLIHGKYLSELAVEYAQRNPNIEINFKLHPDEYSKENSYRKLFAVYENIHLLKSELPMNVLVSRSSLVVLICSTVLFEALHSNAKVAIYNKLDYETLSDCFSLPNVYLFDSTEKLHDAYLAEKKDNAVSFFDKFDKNLFHNLLK